MLYICYNIDVERGQDDPTNSQLDGNCFKYRSGYNARNHSTQYEEVRPCGGESLHPVENSKTKEVQNDLKYYKYYIVFSIFSVCYYFNTTNKKKITLARYTRVIYRKVYDSTKIIIPLKFMFVKLNI